jgi:protein O-GlcNAc transferase
MKLTVERTLLKGRSHQKKGELDEARAVYTAVLEAFPNNKRAKLALASLDQPKEFDRLISLHSAGRTQDVIWEGTSLLEEFSSSFVLWNILGAAHKANGQLDNALAAYEHALSLKPDDAEIYNNIGNVLKDQGKLEDAIAVYERALSLKPDYAVAWYNMGGTLRVQDKLEDAIAAYERALSLKPNYADAHYNIGVTLQQQGKLEDAIAAFERVLSLEPDDAEVYNNMGVMLKEQGKLSDAIAAYERALSLKPDYAIAYNNMGATLQQKGRLEDAIAAYERALSLKPDYADACYNMGVTLQQQGKLSDAIAAYERAMSLKPDHADACYNMGVTLQQQGKLEDAIAAYERAVSLKPNYADAYVNMGNTLQEQGKLEDAIAAHKRALSLKPDYAGAYFNMGGALREQGKMGDAIAAYESALSLKPDYASAYVNMGGTLQEQGKLEDAIAAYESALSLKPDHAEVEAQMLHQQQHVCDFSISKMLSHASARLGITTEMVEPFTGLSWLDNPEHQLQRSKAWAVGQYSQSPPPLQARPKIRPKLLKIGYFSADFHDHATMYLMSGLLRHHNAEQFEVFAFSYGRFKSGDGHKRAAGSVDHFFDVAGQSDSQISDLARDHGLDIAIDLKGYTAQTQSGIFQYRLAPIQINYLGYPGSMGADFIDYIIADPVVIAADQRQFYSEKIIYLPNSYQPNDNTREIASTDTTRADFGLPENAFVFCCFNNSYKIGSSEFDIWMRLLNRVNGSVLWLLQANKWAEQNLRREAQIRGVDPDRLVFAERVPHSEHLARHKHADLFVDTFNYNAHTTASDALWGGLPVVTKQGKQFAARVAASLLTSVGLSELITNSEEEYEKLILDLAMQPQRLSGIKAKLAANRLTEPLFDTLRYTQNFEKGLQKAYDIFFANEQPTDIWVVDDELVEKRLPET